MATIIKYSYLIKYTVKLKRIKLFFKHKNQAWPPSLSKAGKLGDGDKSDLLVCLQGLAYYPNGISQVDAKILDGAVSCCQYVTNYCSINIPGVY